MFADDSAAGTQGRRRCRIETIIVDSERRAQIAFLNGPLFLPAVGSTIELGLPRRDAVVRSTRIALPRRRRFDSSGEAVAVAIVDVDDPGPH